MNEFTYARAESVEQAAQVVRGDAGARYLAGGTNLVDHLKLGLLSPSRLVDVRGVLSEAIEETGDGASRGLRIGAGVRNSDLAAHPLVRRDHPALSRALLAGASGQLRHQATTGGNLLQRTRCVAFTDPSVPCHKREPGSGCTMIGGPGRDHALFGTSQMCVAVSPSDMVVALAALDARVVVLSADGTDTMPLVDLYREPGDDPSRDTVLSHGDLVTAVELGAPAPRSTYRKVRDRASYAFAIASVAVVMRDDGPRIAWGGVATRPWRARRAEAALAGVARPSRADVADALAPDLGQARTTPENAFKLDILRAVTARLVAELSDPERATGRTEQDGDAR